MYRSIARDLDLIISVYFFENVYSPVTVHIKNPGGYWRRRWLESFSHIVYIATLFLINGRFKKNSAVCDMC